MRRDQILFCHLALVAMETDEFYHTMMEPMGYKMYGVEMESGWMVTTLHSVWDSNVTGGDRRRLRSPSFNPNDRGGCHSLPCSL